jgi:hypothetical protein
MPNSVPDFIVTYNNFDIETSESESQSTFYHQMSSPAQNLRKRAPSDNPPPVKK